MATNADKKEALAYLLAAVLTGIVLGILRGPVYILIPWAIAGIVLGFLSKRKRCAMIRGAAFGFFASFVFMLSGYNGTASVISRIPFFAILGLFGAICGLILGLIGYFSKKLLKK
jgi:hypothetical protein